ncbi:hypothetical protein LF1_25660 [Rubripirellula obstinata]|uniref:Uncharacterized protein n=1 Tax=Rubripirellula obstinata TaxID=406547 RepID=A0A5B1CFQ2_9BACT|nr:hypothetical protein [Rubripirellula obstinata]KAA1260028.1 hypothetical protein LF1_25660 [Rubripirellula obstinata]
MKLTSSIRFAFAALIVFSIGGCSLFPETRNRDVIHNPFPQLKRVAVLPFFNQSEEPTVDGDAVGSQYYASLQAVPGFEVLPMGVTKTAWIQYSLHNGEPRTGADFQAFARHLGVEAVVVGAVTDFKSFYPPQMAMTVHWYAANEGFHAIPPGYGLPWGTEQEKQIPRRVLREAEFELARSQLATQSPISVDETPGVQNAIQQTSANRQVDVQFDAEEVDPFAEPNFAAPMSPEGEIYGGQIMDGEIMEGEIVDGEYFHGEHETWETPLPPAWPDPTDLIPDGPSPVRPMAITNHEPILTHTKIYRGDDPYVTGRLADYVETGDDARNSGWQGYLKRTDDFVRFCCHLHITEMLESRGGRDQSDFIMRWSLSRY